MEWGVENRKVAAKEKVFALYQGRTTGVAFSRTQSVDKQRREKIN